MSQKKKQKIKTGINDPVAALREAKEEAKSATGTDLLLLQFKIQFLSEMIATFEQEWEYMESREETVNRKEEEVETEWIKIRDQYLILASIKRELDEQRRKG